MTDTIYDIAMQGTNRAGGWYISSSRVTAQTKDYEKRPLDCGGMNQKFWQVVHEIDSELLRLEKALECVRGEQA